MERLESKVADLNRQLAQCQTQERAAAKAAKAAEASAKGLREELAKMKNTVVMIRAACSNDVRKRDLQIQKLKTHLTVQQRGSRSAATAMTIVIQPGTTGVVQEVTNTNRQESSVGVEDAGYSLKQETAEFLTELSQSLSDENDNLISLVRSTLATLKGLQGLPENVERLPTIDEAILPEESVNNMLSAPPVSYDILANDMERVLENLRNILTNPNFVPIEEIAVREEEIAKLREGWDHMEHKWRETILMMDNWRKRVLSGDDTINMDEIKRVLGMGRQMNMDTGLLDDSVMALTDAGDSDDEHGFHSEDGDLSLAQSEDQSSFVQASPSPVRSRQPLVPAAVNGNNRSPKKVAFQVDSSLRHDAIADENASESERTTSGRSTSTADSRGRGPRKSLIPTTRKTDGQHNVRHIELTGGVAAVPTEDKVYMYIDVDQSRKRSSSPAPHPDEPSRKLTVQEKINIAQAEAEAAAVAAGISLDAVDGAIQEDADVPQTNVTSRKIRKTGVKGRPRRRKSTLTPDELEQLMLVS
jgi:hypothetical protein